MAILNIIKKGYIHLKVGGAYIKLLPRTLATLVSMSDGRSVENAIDELNRKLPAIGTNYIKYPDGVQICWGTFGNNTPVTFPVPFSANPSMSNMVVAADPSNTHTYTAYVMSLSETGFTAQIRRDYGDIDGASQTATYIAIGRWK